MEILDNKTFLTVKDYTVSGEAFELKYDSNLDLLVTYPQPDIHNLSKYYDSDDYISHTDAKRSLFEKAYHFIKNIALKNKIGLINSFQLGKGSLLDIGAGTGDFLVTAKENGWKVTGIEPSEKARAHASDKNIVLQNNSENLPNHTYDVITMWHVLEHVPNLDHQIKELKRLLKPDGTIVIAVPNFNSYDAKYYGKFWAAFDVPRHLWHFSKTAIAKIFEAQDIKLVKVLPMKFDSFYVALLSEKYKSGKMNYLKAFWIGWLSNLKAHQNKEHSSHIYILKNTKS